MALILKNPPLILSLVLFVAACCLPCLEFHHSAGREEIHLGANILAVGWSGIFVGVMGWYANPFWLAGMILGAFHKSVLAAVCGAIAILIAFSTYSLIGRTLPADEGDVTHMTLLRLLPGFYVWMASLVVLPFVIFSGNQSDPFGERFARYMIESGKPRS